MNSCKAIDSFEAWSPLKDKVFLKTAYYFPKQQQGIVGWKKRESNL